MLFVLFGYLLRKEVSGRTAVVSWIVAYWISSKQHVAFLYSSHLAFFSLRFLSIRVVHPYSSTNTVTYCKKLRFILSDWLDFHMTDNLSIDVHSFSWHILTSLSVDEILLPRYVNMSTNFRVGVAPSRLKHMTCFICVYKEANSCKLCCSVFGRNTRLSALSASDIISVGYFASCLFLA